MLFGYTTKKVKRNRGKVISAVLYFPYVLCFLRQEREGNPVIFPKILFEELMALEGDKGGKRIAKEHPEMIYKVYVTEQELSDMDYQEDKINLEKNII
mgnify:CR=1 FL=1